MASAPPDPEPEAFSEVQDTNECPKTKFDRDMRMFEFYGYPPSWFTDEIHGILNDEFLESVEAMKEKMIKLHPDRKEEIEESYISFSKSVRTEMNKAMEKLRLYYEKNFAIPASIPLYGEKIKRGGEGEGAMPRGEATKRVEELYRQIVITESFNDRKRRELKQIEEEIKIKESMKREVIELKEEMALLQQMNIMPKPLQK